MKNNKAQIVGLVFIISLLILSWYHIWLGFLIALFSLLFGIATKHIYEQPKTENAVQWPALFFTVCWITISALASNSKTFPYAQNCFIEGKIYSGYIDDVDEDGTRISSYERKFIPNNKRDDGKVVLITILLYVAGMGAWAFCVYNIITSSYINERPGYRKSKTNSP